MEARSLDFVCRACGGELICGSPEAKVLRVSTDSRQVRTGDLFVAIKGDKFDGHDFVADVMAKGAGAVLVERARATRGNAAVIAEAVESVVLEGKARIPRSGYFIRRGRGRVIIEQPEE